MPMYLSVFYQSIHKIVHVNCLNIQFDSLRQLLAKRFKDSQIEQLSLRMFIRDFFRNYYKWYSVESKQDYDELLAHLRSLVIMAKPTQEVFQIEVQIVKDK